MNEAEIRKAMRKNLENYEGANDATKALIQANNEALSKELSTITGGNKDAVTTYIEYRDALNGEKYDKYNPEKDPAYSALKKQALRESDRSVEDTMGIYAGMTGGLPSTAAVTAAQEMANYHRGQLADRQVELGEQDYNRWLNDQNAKRQMMSIYATEAEESAANLAALGDFSAMGKLYGWTPEQIAEAQRLWLAEQGGSGGGYKTGDELAVPENASLFPQEVLTALGYGDGGGTPSTITASKVGATKKVDENEVYNKVINIVGKMPKAQAWTVINNGTTFTGAEKEAAIAMYKEIYS